MIVKICKSCKKKFNVWPYRKEASYCSRICAGKGKIGTQGFWKDKKFSETHRNNIRLAVMIDPHRRGKNHWNWKGDKAGYFALHCWINRWLGRPRFCEFCKNTKAKNYEWANRSGKYKRELGDWIRLCKKCHVEFDDTINRGWITRKARIYVA